MVRVLRPTLRIRSESWVIQTLPASQAMRRAVSAETGVLESPIQARLGAGGPAAGSPAPADALPIRVDA